MELHQRKRVAIVGSGLAGLVTAHLLSNDTRQRYAVKIFESVRPPPEIEGTKSMKMGGLIV
jgi:2-polyprenyl-6-methoxyphenol hydroxylase-like FAD-dependent oxidoreductase